MQKLPVTKIGYARLEAEHKELKFEDRPIVIDQISEAREHGDLKENAEYLIDNETEEEKTYQIVGEYEADLENGKISITSPIAKALIGKEEGDMALVVTPSGKKSYEVLSVKYL